MRILPLICVIVLYLGACELVEFLLVRIQAGEVFPPKLGWRLLRWCGIAQCIAGIVGRLHRTVERSDTGPILFYLFLLVIWAYWPRTVRVDSSSVSSSSLFGFNRSAIHWGEVSRVTSDWQEEKLTYNLFTVIWTFMGTSINVASRYGPSIQHGVVNQRQGLFLDALRRNLPADVFDPGIYDWHP